MAYVLVILELSPGCAELTLGPPCQPTRAQLGKIKAFDQYNYYNRNEITSLCCLEADVIRF